MASLTTHTPYKPGQWAADQIRVWQFERAAGLRSMMNLMERVGAQGVMASDRIHGFWWDTEKPPDQKWWKPLATPNPHNRAGQYRSAIGRHGRGIWTPATTVAHRGVRRHSPLFDEFHAIRIRDWWDFAIMMNLRPSVWPGHGLMILPELEVLGDYGEHVVVWSPVDRFGGHNEPVDCVKMTQEELQKIYSTAWRDIKRPPVIESYVGGEIQFRFEKEGK